MKEYTENIYNIKKEDRVKIGRTFSKIPIWKKIIGIPLIYIPALISLPFIILAASLVRWHLIFIGARNLKKYRNFIPDRKSYRYSYRNQIIQEGEWYNRFIRIKLFWFYNCGIYCPLSVGLLEYFSYLVKVVENWWCPFYHDKKSNYANAPIDQSFWHIIPEDKVKMSKEDANCPIYTDEKDK